MDVLWWAVALMILAWVPHRDPRHFEVLPELALIGFVGGVLHVSVGLGLRVYQVGHERGSFDEVAALIRTTAVAGLLLALVITLIGDCPPLLGVVGGAVALVLMLGPRLSVRLERHRRASARCRGMHTIILGAGAGGRHLLNSMLSHDEHYRPVAFLDDDPAKRRLRINGVPVLGNRTDLQSVATRTGATHLAVAIPSIRSEDLRAVRELAHAAGLKVLVLPPLDALLGLIPNEGVVGV